MSPRRARRCGGQLRGLPREVAVAVASSSRNVAPRFRPSLVPRNVPPWASTIERLMVNPNPNPARMRGHRPVAPLEGIEQVKDVVGLDADTIVGDLDGPGAPGRRRACGRRPAPPRACTSRR